MEDPAVTPAPPPQEPARAPLRGEPRRPLSLRPARRHARALGAALVAALAAGCAAQRTLEITSVPPGARVRLDGELVGATPLVHRFTHYGTRRVTLYLDGYRTHSQRLAIEPPWYGAFPFDFFSEVVFPVGWKDRHVLGVDLEPELEAVSESDLLDVLERADRFRRATPQGPRDPLPPPDLDAPPTDPPDGVPEGAAPADEEPGADDAGDGR